MTAACPFTVYELWLGGGCVDVTHPAIKTNWKREKGGSDNSRISLSIERVKRVVIDIKLVCVVSVCRTRDTPVIARPR